jgi:uroporphyrinogen III methyltransferase/synthase
MKAPSVYIIGAGPGDPSLVSLRGVRLLGAADVVIYDHHVHPETLRMARPGAELIDVGPAAPRPHDQEAISILVAEKAREGKVVARLKWGDPFVFDSGGKEALFLHEQDIPFEVVPGVPAAIGGSAYAGVPITYPGAGDTLVLVRGHESETDAPPEADWPALAQLTGTLACYAGARQIAAITRALLAGGRRGDEPAVLIYDGTRPSQQTLEGTLETIAGQARPDAPGLLVIGAVAALRSHLRWYDDRPLFGRRIVVTRSREQAGELIEMLEERGAEVIHAPTIDIAPPDDPGELDAACAEAAAYDWLVFTSANAVDRFMARLLASGDVRDLKGVKICAVGPSTAARLARFGVRADLTPDEYRSEGVVQALVERGEVQGRRFLLPRADLARDTLVQGLQDAGGDVREVVAYRTVLASPDHCGDHDIYRMLLDRQIDAVTFTSASTVRNFVTIFGEEQAPDLLRGTTVAAIGPVTAQAAEQLGITAAVVPARYTVPDLVDALVDHFTAAAAADRSRP